jgi:GWxTD domain-containing protein
LVLNFSPFISAQNRQEKKESKDYFKKWLEEDVKYIISDPEKEVFNKLTTAEEKENFIEQFWLRRDPDPRTKINEFKEEHYRRMAYANERFRSGKPGWMTDRGRVYIIHGEPASIESYPSGGNYTRKPWEGGGQTFAYPFEIWKYREMEGIGQDVELEFVDPSFSGEYRLALRPEEKDMLLMVPGTAPTIYEAMGRDPTISINLRRDQSLGRVMRPYFSPGLENESSWQAAHGYRSQDAPFARYARFVNAQKPPEPRFPDLRQNITANITYHNLPFYLRTDFIRVSEDQILVPVTVEVENKNLTFESRNGVYTAHADIYGMVRSLTGKIEAEFEDAVIAEYKPEFFEQGKKIKSVYQKKVLLQAGQKYRLNVVVKDDNSGRTGVTEAAVSIPSEKAQSGLTTSSLILSRLMASVRPDGPPDEMFVLGDVKIIPNATNVFALGEWLGIYLQVYGMGMDQESLQPKIHVRYVIRDGDKVVQEFQDLAGKTVRFASGQRVVLIRQIQLKDLKSGAYQLDVEVEDMIGKKSVAAHGKFNVAE